MMFLTTSYRWRSKKQWGLDKSSGLFALGFACVISFCYLLSAFFCFLFLEGVIIGVAVYFSCARYEHLAFLFSLVVKRGKMIKFDILYYESK